MTALCLILVALIICSTAGVENVVKVEVPSRVSGRLGDPVILPCKFTSPYAHYTTVEITVLWRIRKFFKGPVIFQSVIQDNNTMNVKVNAGKRYMLVGNPRDQDASLQLDRAELEDNEDYFCRVEISRKMIYTSKHESNPGITLEVTGPPLILNMTLHKVNQTHEMLTCTAEGEPRPTITWANPRGNQSSVSHNLGRYQIESWVHNPHLTGNYTCTVTNHLGIVFQTFYNQGNEEKLSPELLWVICGSAAIFVVILLVAVFLIIWKIKKDKGKYIIGTCESSEGLRAVHEKQRLTDQRSECPPSTVTTNLCWEANLRHVHDQL